MGIGNGRLELRMLESPFQNAMDDQVWVAADWRSEMSVLVEAQREMAQRLRGVTRLLEGAKHQVGDDALFRFAGDFANEALIMPGSDAPIAGAGQADFHAAFAAVSVGIGAAGARGSGDAAVADGDFALVQVFDAERIAEGAGQLFKLQNFFGVGDFVDAMEGFDATLREIAVHGAIG